MLILSNCIKFYRLLLCTTGCLPGALGVLIQGCARWTLFGKDWMISNNTQNAAWCWQRKAAAGRQDGRQAAEICACGLVLVRVARAANINNNGNGKINISQKQDKCEQCGCRAVVRRMMDGWGRWRWLRLNAGWRQIELVKENKEERKWQWVQSQSNRQQNKSIFGIRKERARPLWQRR